MMVDVTSRSRSSVLAMQAVCALLLTAPFLRDVYVVTAEPTDGPSSPLYWMRESAVGVALVAALVLCWATARQGERGARTWAVVALILVGIRGVGTLVRAASVNSIGAGVVELASGALLALCAMVLLVLTVRRWRVLRRVSAAGPGR